MDEEFREQNKVRLHNTLRGFDGDSRVLVEYHRKIEIGGQTYGRLYSNGAGYHMLWRVLRGALVRHAMAAYGTRMYDIDMENAHPNLFA